MEDVEAPTGKPFVHLVALADPAVTALAEGALAPATAPAGARLLKSSMGRGYIGPAPIKGHGPHRYVFSCSRWPRPQPATRRRTRARARCPARSAARCSPAAGSPAPMSASCARSQ
jgi:phosphatidylethanolamine-binding protein (PEBP) family uncharacterized protein